MLGRILSLLSIPLMGFTIWGLIRQVRKEQRFKLSTPVVGLVMAPITLLINILLLRQAFSACLGPALLIFGRGFGLPGAQPSRLYAKGGALVGKRSVLHLVFWGISYAVTQILASVAPATWVAGGLVAMFFSTGSTLGTNLNLLVRQLRMRPSLAAAAAAASPPPVLPERAKAPSSLPLPERVGAAAPVPPGLPERGREATPPGLPERKPRSGIR